MPPNPARAADEGRHAPTDEPLWTESYYLDFVSADATFGGYVRMALLPNRGVAWYWACVVGEGRPLVTVIDQEAPIPPPPGLELRTTGLWSDLVVETPLDHVSLGIEAFAVGLDDPTEVFRSGRGDRVPLGFDLEWETDAPPHADSGSYEIPCRVHGEILVGHEAIDFVGWGHRNHSWGALDWWAHEWCWVAGRLDDGTRIHGMATTSGTEIGANGFPVRVNLELGPLGLASAEPVAWAPVMPVAPDGRCSQLARAMCRFVADDGRRGVGWVELNQPEAAT